MENEQTRELVSFIFANKHKKNFDFQDKVRELLNNGANPNALMYNKEYNILTFFIHENNYAMVLLLLLHGADPNAEHERFHRVHFVPAKHTEIIYHNPDGTVKFKGKIIEYDYKMIELLSGFGFDLDKERCFFDDTTLLGNTFLWILRSIPPDYHLSVECKEWERVEKLVQRGAKNITVTDLSLFLKISTEKNISIDPDIFEYLLEKEIFTLDTIRVWVKFNGDNRLLDTLKMLEK